MEDDDPVEIPDLTPGRAIQLTKTALAANQALQDELILRAEQLEAEIQEADRLVVSHPLVSCFSLIDLFVFRMRWRVGLILKKLKTRYKFPGRGERRACFP